MEYRPAKRVVVTFLAVLGVGCATTMIDPDKYYPGDWPAVVTGGECQALQRTYKNRGVLVDEKGRRSAIWMTDLFGKQRAPKEVVDARRALQRFEFATLKLEPGTPHSRSTDVRRTVVLELSHGRPDRGFSEDEPAAIFKLAGSYGQGGFCLHGALFGLRSEVLGVGETMCALGAAADRSLIVKCINDVGGIVVVVPVFIRDHYWARFSAEQQVAYYSVEEIESAQSARVIMSNDDRFYLNAAPTARILRAAAWQQVEGD